MQKLRIYPKNNVMEDEHVDDYANESLSIPWMLLSFFFPIVGIIIFFIQKSKGGHKKAYIAITCACVAILINLIYYYMIGEVPSF